MGQFERDQAAQAGVTTVAGLLAEARRLPGDEARREAEVLLCAALDKPRSYLFAWSDASVPEDAKDRYLHWIEERVRGVPVAYLLGQREFWSLALRVDSSTLIPRADTELLVAQALTVGSEDSALTVADLGTGSGAIALALAHERPAWKLSAVDASADALAMATANRDALGLGNVRLLHGDWFAPLAGRQFDLIVSNPPYIASGDAYLRRGDLPFEPASALVAGVDGLDDLRQIIGEAPAHLVPGGQLILEHGASQGEAVRDLLRGRGFETVATHCDLAGLERVSVGRWPVKPC